ncbi:MAG: TldD/PmbA family protein [bacterium]|nr:TldD/PmbA family protein [bacterium]
MEKIIKEAKNRNLRYEVFSSKVETKSINFEQSQLKDISHKIVEGVGVRILKDGRVGFSNSNQIDNVEVLDYAINSAKYAKEVKYDFPEIEEVKFEYGNFQSEINFESIFGDVKDIINYLEEKYHGKVDFHLVEMNSENYLTNYKTDRIAYSRVKYFDFSLSLFTITEAGFIFTGKWGWSKSKFSREELWNATKEMEKTLTGHERIAKIKSGKYRVIFSPFVVGSTLALSIGSGVNGLSLARKMSPLQNKLNEKILHESITILDDPEIDMPGSCVIDDEGIKAEKRPIVEHGVLKNFVLNLDTSADLNMKPTGNGKRGGYASLPAPDFHNLIMKEGNSPLDRMVKSIDKGILFLFPIGAGQSNIMMGDYSVNVGLGYYIENGEIVGRVKDTMISGNIYEDFQRVIEISSDFEDIPSMRGKGFARFPYVLLDGISVTTK